MTIKQIGCIPCVAFAIVIAGCVEQASRTAVDTAGPDATTAVFAGDPVENGEISFALYCVSCHGEFGKGDGPVASALTKPPSNLTVLTKNNGGTFPADAVYEFVDGRRDVEAHGTRDMPVWGNIWSETRDGKPISPEVIAVRIGELVEYIRSIQEE